MDPKSVFIQSLRSDTGNTPLRLVSSPQMFLKKLCCIHLTWGETYPSHTICPHFEVINSTFKLSFYQVNARSYPKLHQLCIDYSGRDVYLGKCKRGEKWAQSIKRQPWLSNNSPFSAISDQVDGGETTFNLTRSRSRFVLQVRARGLWIFVTSAVRHNNALF